MKTIFNGTFPDGRFLHHRGECKYSPIIAYHYGLTEAVIFDFLAQRLQRRQFAHPDLKTLCWGEISLGMLLFVFPEFSGSTISCAIRNLHFRKAIRIKEEPDKEVLYFAINTENDIIKYTLHTMIENGRTALSNNEIQKPSYNTSTIKLPFVSGDSIKGDIKKVWETYPDVCKSSKRVTSKHYFEQTVLQDIINQYGIDRVVEVEENYIKASEDNGTYLYNFGNFIKKLSSMIEDYDAIK